MTYTLSPKLSRVNFEHIVSGYAGRSFLDKAQVRHDASPLTIPPRSGILTFAPGLTSQTVLVDLVGFGAMTNEQAGDVGRSGDVHRVPVGPEAIERCFGLAPDPREPAVHVRVAEEREHNIHVRNGISEEQFVAMRPDQRRTSCDLSTSSSKQRGQEFVLTLARVARLDFQAQILP